MERVWGIPRTVLFELLPPFQGFAPSPGPLEEIGERFEGAGEFRPRGEVERDPSWKQIIPYVAITHGERVLVLERLATQGEARLHWTERRELWVVALETDAGLLADLDARRALELLVDPRTLRVMQGARGGIRFGAGTWSKYP